MASDKSKRHVEVQEVQKELAAALGGDVSFDEVAEGVKHLDGSEAGELVHVKKIVQESILAVFFRRELDLMKARIQAPIIAVSDRIKSCVKGVIDRVSDAIIRRTLPMVVNPINRLPNHEFTRKGKVLTGEDIARAIPDKTAFLAELHEMKDPEFFEINEEGQLVMREAKLTPVANALEAKILQTRITYCREDGAVAVMTGEEFFIVTERYGNGVPRAMQLSEAAKQISPESILMKRGLPTLQWSDKPTGECIRIGTEIGITWTDDESLDLSHARWVFHGRGWISEVCCSRDTNRSVVGRWRVGPAMSYGILRVNLDFES